MGDAVDVYAAMCGTTADDVRAQVLDFVRDHLAKATLVRLRAPGLATTAEQRP